MANQIPDKIIEYVCYDVNKSNEMLGLTTVDLPEIKYLSDSIKGSGILGQFESSAIGMVDSLETTLNFRTFTGDMASMLGNQNGVNLELRGIEQRYDSGTNRKVPQQIIIALAGDVKSASLGTLDTAAQMSSSLVVEAYRLKITVAGVVTFEIDKFARVFNVNGSDLYAEVRQMLGK